MRTSWKKPPENGATRNKLLWSLAALGAAGALAGLGTFATFTTTTTEQYGDINTGDLVLTVGAVGSLDVNNIVPGDTIQRRVNLTNDGDSLGPVTLMVTVDPDDAPEPYEDPSRIMTLAVDQCEGPNAWDTSGNTFVCEDANGDPVAPTPVFVGTEPLLGAHPLSTLSGMNGTAHLRFTLAFPDDAGDNYQNRITTVGYTFLGVQRDDGAQ